MAQRHSRETFFIVGEGVHSFGSQEGAEPVARQPSVLEETRKFRFSRMAEKPGERPSKELLTELGKAMIGGGGDSAGDKIPAGFTYLGQFVDHDLTRDNTSNVQLGDPVTVEQLVQGRTPTLDLDSLYGRGPAEDALFYAADGIHLKVGRTAGSAFPTGNAVAATDLDGFDLPRVGTGSDKQARRQAQIPDTRNDENLIVAQTHLAFIRFHNKVVDKLASSPGDGTLFERARAEAVKHYQWMLRTDFLPRIVDNAVIDDVFQNGRKFFEVGAPNRERDRFATMPIEFSVAAYRLGHSMIRSAYEWNPVFETGGPGPVASLALLFNFSGTSGTLSPGGDASDRNSGAFERLPTNWVADWRRLYDFPTDAGRADLAPPVSPPSGTKKFNNARPLDTLLVDPLKELPPGSFGGPATEERNLATRNLLRGRMVALSSGQEMAEQFGVTALTRAEILEGKGGARPQLSNALTDELVNNTPLWFYILREAEVGGTGRLGAVGSRIVVETFHRAMETSEHSIIRDVAWKPTLGHTAGNFKMVDVLLIGSDGRLDQLSPLG